MKDIRITENHPIKKRYILGPLGRVILKLINWDIAVSYTHLTLPTIVSV